MPENCIGDDDYSGAKWLWTIHDMVNQKLGKQCIPFSVMVNRYKTFTHLASVYDIIDVCALLAIQAETVESTLALVKIVPILRSCIRPSSQRQCLSDVTAEFATPDNIWIHFVNCRNKLNESVGEACITIEQAHAQYSHAKIYIEPTTKVPSSSTSSSRTSRRRRRA